jgi:serine/threonine protein kinase
VHGDIKPDNICVRPWPQNDPAVQPDGQQREYQFTLIDFGLASKFKFKKINRVYDSHFGNLMYSSLRGL